MRRFRLHLFVLPILAAMGLAGCASGGRYYVSGPPPPARYQARIVAPGPGMVWTSGYYNWNNRGYTWVPGRWVRPPRAGAVWIAPRWEAQRNGRYVFRNGRWR